MPGKSKKGGGLESSPVYKKQGYGEAKSPFMMKGFSGFRNSSPLHNDDEYVAKQLAKAEKLKLLAEKREKRTEEKKEAFSKAGKKWEGVEPIFFSGKRARKREKIARLKAAAGSRKAYRKSKRQ